MAEKTANGAEVAAIAAAIARFQSEFAAAPAAPKDAIGPWQRQALLEGVGAKQNIQDPQGGGARWQS